MPVFNFKSVASGGLAASVAQLFRFPLGKPHRQHVKGCKCQHYEKQPFGLASNKMDQPFRIVQQVGSDPLGSNPQVGKD